MGLFDSFNPIKAVTRILPKPVARVVAPVTKLATAVTKLQPKTLLSAASKGPVLGPLTFATSTLAPKYAPAVNLAANVATALVPGGQAKMAINLGGILNTVSGIFGGNQNPIFQGISNVTSLASQFVPQPTAQPVAARTPQILGPVMRSVPTIGRGFFNRYPNLATGMQMLRNQGRNIKRGQLYSMLKRFGPEMLITGGILTAAAVSELIQAGPGRRTMNPANAKALRRAARRIKSFHKLCQHTDLIKTRSRSRSVGSRCGTCRKSPCRC